MLAGVRFKGSMRWRGDIAFSRPMRWLLALHGPAAVPFQFAGLTADRTTRVLRNATPPVAQVHARHTGAEPLHPDPHFASVRCFISLPLRLTQLRPDMNAGGQRGGVSPDITAAQDRAEP